MIAIFFHQESSSWTPRKLCVNFQTPSQSGTTPSLSGGAIGSVTPLCSLADDVTEVIMRPCSVRLERCLLSSYFWDVQKFKLEDETVQPVYQSVRVGWTKVISLRMLN